MHLSRGLCVALATIMPGCASATSALANDSMAEVAIGGLVLKESPDIAMDQEDLYISRAEVRGDYGFTNTAAEDIEALVAFPLPDQDFSDMLDPAHDLAKELRLHHGRRQTRQV